ncbi:MAG: nucleotidyltransferase domain-containing protein [Spirochaetota bacterium]
MPTLSERDKAELDLAIALLRRLGAKEVYLFGSMARGDADDHSDWDLAVRGLPPQAYFSTLGKLSDSMSRTVDLVDLDEGSPFVAHVLSKKDLIRVA